jgi:hypothetical protein
VDSGDGGSILSVYIKIDELSRAFVLVVACSFLRLAPFFCSQGVPAIPHSVSRSLFNELLPGIDLSKYLSPSHTSLQPASSIYRLFFAAVIAEVHVPPDGSRRFHCPELKHPGIVHEAVPTPDRHRSDRPDGRISRIVHDRRPYLRHRFDCSRSRHQFPGCGDYL